MVVGATLPYPVMHTPDRHNGIGDAFDVLFSRLATSFSDVQFFGSDRRVDFVAWARRKSGEPDRIFAFGCGDVFANIGKQTPEEMKFGLPNLDDLPLEQATEKMFEDVELQPDEDVPSLIAELWSINPVTLDEIDLPSSCGVVVEVPNFQSS